MRLPKVEHGHPFKQKVALFMISLMVKARAPDVIRTMMYRQDYFGKRLGPIAQRTMRGPSGWSVGERELFAAFVSRLNKCPF